MLKALGFYREEAVYRARQLSSRADYGVLGSSITRFRNVRFPALPLRPRLRNQISRRVKSRARAGGCAGNQDVSGFESAEMRNVGNQEGHRENHPVGRIVLANLAIHSRDDSQRTGPISSDVTIQGPARRFLRSFFPA